jgi:hypothetical protein
MEKGKQSLTDLMSTKLGRSLIGVKQISKSNAVLSPKDWNHLVQIKILNSSVAMRHPHERDVSRVLT